MDSNPNTWWIYALLSAFFGALTTIFAKIGVQNIDANLATAVRTVVMVAIAWGFVFLDGNIHQLSSIPHGSIVMYPLLLASILCDCTRDRTYYRSICVDE
jgi:bacterial/archaeal transporter family protein